MKVYVPKEYPNAQEERSVSRSGITLYAYYKRSVDDIKHYPGDPIYEEIADRIFSRGYNNFPNAVRNGTRIEWDHTFVYYYTEVESFDTILKWIEEERRSFIIYYSGDDYPIVEYNESPD